jgi:hypothetical protein
VERFPYLVGYDATIPVGAVAADGTIAPAIG